MDKRLPLLKWVLINRPKRSQMPQFFLPNLSAQAQKVLDFNEKRLHLASVVRGSMDLPKELVFVLNCSTFKASKITLDIKSSGWILWKMSLKPKLNWGRFFKYRVFHIELFLLKWLWQIGICKLDFAWRYLYIPEVWKFEFHQPVSEKVT